ncbi:hypothetical protein GCM10022265_19330 [Marinobacter xestospongiae]
MAAFVVALVGVLVSAILIFGGGWSQAVFLLCASLVAPFFLVDSLMGKRPYVVDAEVKQ